MAVDDQDPSPIAEAIRRVRTIADGPEARLLDRHAPAVEVDAFLRRQATLFELIDRGALSTTEPWRPPVTDVTRLQIDALATSDLCRLAMLAARRTLAAGDPARACEGLVAMKAFCRNVTRGLPFPLVMGLELDNEQMLLRCLAEIAPSLDVAQRRELAARLAAALRFFAMQLRDPIAPPGLARGLEMFSAWCRAAADALDGELTHPTDALRPRLVDVAATLGADAPPIGRTLATRSVDIVAKLHDRVHLHREWIAMFDLGLAILCGRHDGVTEVAASGHALRYEPGAASSFTIHGTSLNRCTGRPIALRFGDAPPA